MQKIQSLILLINTLSKSEKKAIQLQSELLSGEKKYMHLFSLIVDRSIEDSAILQQEYSKSNSKASFHVQVQYLYDYILGVLTKLKINKDLNFALHRKLLNVQILKERNLDENYYSALLELKEDAEKMNNYQILLQVNRMELDFLRTNNFLGISEKELQKKQHKISETLKILRQINEQSTLYELLLYRIEKASVSGTILNQKLYSDLVLSELSLVNNLNKEVFEIQKLHQLFQAYYFNTVGDYRSALNSFIELDELFNRNKELWNNPPLYYMSVLEGILDSLARKEQYDEMPYFFNKLKEIEYASLPFQTEVASITFNYTSISLRNSGKSKDCLELIDAFQENLIKKSDLLTPFRLIQLSIEMAIVYLENKQFAKAKKALSPIIINNSYTSFKSYRVAQLVYVLISYELDETDFMQSQIRSIKRYNKINKKTSPLEDALFSFLNINLFVLSEARKDQLRLKIENDFIEIRRNREDLQILQSFDFERWIISHI